VYWLPYNTALKTFSRQLRNHSTLGEILLWQQLRAATMGYPFNRQKPLDRYIVDFYCKPLQVVIEVDGAYHFEAAQKIKDAERQQVLENLELHFLRFEDETVKKDMPLVLQKIAAYIAAFEEEHPQIKLSKKKISG
jgi:very-short-patch-repair endonuclease